MEISKLGIDTASEYTAQQPIQQPVQQPATADDSTQKSDSAVNAVLGAAIGAAAIIQLTGSPAVETTEQNKTKEADVVDEKKLHNTTSSINQFLSSMDNDLRFSVHKDTNMLMVQIVDEKKNKVIKEFPSHEFLDVIAKVRRYIGFILDKKA